MNRPRQIPKLLCLLLALIGLAPGGGRARAADTLRLTQNVPGDSKPIILYADEIVTWTEGSQRIILLRGTVMVEHGIVHARTGQAAVWIDQDKARRTGILHAEVYCEGDVFLESGPGSKQGAKALLDLFSRGELRLKSQKNKVLQQPMPDDAVLKRGLGERFPPETPATSPIQRTSYSEVVPTTGSVTPTQNPPPAPANPAPAGAPPLFPISPSPVPGGSPSPAPAGAAPIPIGQPASPVQTTPAIPVLPTPRPVPGTPAPAQTPTANLEAPFRNLRIVPRTGAPFQVQSKQLANGEQAYLVNGGVILTISDTTGARVVDIEADRLLVWTKGDLQTLFANMRTSEGHRTREVEFYLTGNVEFRIQTGKEIRTLRAEEVYYDANRNVAVARKGDLEFKQPGLPDPVHLRADELLKLSDTQYQGIRAEVFSSRLPSDPGLKVLVDEANVEEKRVPKRTIFGFQFRDRNGNPETENQRLFRGDNLFLELENVPIFYFPFIQGDANDPLGPLEMINYKVDRIFGSQFYTTWNVFDLIGIDPIPGDRWRLDIDYLTKRGPALGTEFDYAGKNLFDLPGAYNGLVKAYGMNDTGTDILGGGRGEHDEHPDWRGRLLFRHRQELPDDFTLQTQVSALSDKNFLEQYYKDEFDRDINQETYLYLKQQRDNWAWTALVEPNIRNWVTETEWLPRGDGYLIGQSFFDRLTYNAHADVAYARLRVTDKPPPPFVTDAPYGTQDVVTNTGRFDLMQELSYPFYLGPVKTVPYGVLDLTYYTEDLTGQDRGRVYGAGGVRASIPFTRLYPDVQSQLLNINGINHKIVFSTNAYIAHSDTPFVRLPQLDRINDDATDQALRDIKPAEPFINPGHGVFLASSPLYDPALYALRRLVDNRVDTLDSIEEVEFDLRQRLQTKRGYPGMEHIVDWMTLDLSASYFPNSELYNFGEHWAFLQYDYLWNIGDRTALASTGWVDPVDNGARVFTIGAFFNRPDRTSFYLGFREIDPLNSQAVSASVNYIFSPKYAMTAASTYDFGTNQSLTNALTFTRIGSDLQVSVGITYNAILNNFGFTFEVFPNLVPEAHRIPGVPAFGSGLLGR